MQNQAIEYFMKNYTKKAFSLIELSIVLLIIGILIAGVTQSSRLIRQFRISSARSMTKSSPVASMKSLNFWYDAVSQESFAIEPDDNAEITAWKDINPVTSLKVDATSNHGPTYVSDCIKSLPCLKFDGDNDYLSITRNLSYGDYTLFIVLDPGTEGEIGYVFHSIYSDLDNQGRLTLLYTDANNAKYSFRYIGSTANLDTWINSENESNPMIYEAYENDAKVAVLINGVEKGSNTADLIPDGARSNEGFTIGAFHGFGTPSNFMSGKVAEFIFFDKALNESERKDVREYLKKKWK